MAELDDLIPPQAWALMLLCLIAVAPVRYLYQHVTRDPRRRDITQKPEDLSWRTPKRFYQSAVTLIVLIALGVFLFTPQARVLARSPVVWAVILAALGAYSLVGVANGFLRHRIEPMVRGSREYSMADEPVRFWLSMAWNAVVGVMLIVGAPSVLSVEEHDPCGEARAEGRPCTVIPAIALENHFARVLERARLDDDAGVRNEWETFRRNAPGWSSQSFIYDLDEESLRRVVALTSRQLEIDPRDEVALEVRGHALWRLGERSASQADDERLEDLRFGEEPEETRVFRARPPADGSGPRTVGDAVRAIGN